MNTQRLLRRPVMLVMILSVIVLAACEDDTEVARERDEVFEASPTTLAGLNEAMGEIVIEITDGEFDAELLDLQEHQPVVLHVVNNDDVDYWLEIGDLVASREIPANEAEEIGFTTPKAKDYEARLAIAEEGDVIDTMIVDIRQAGETGEP